MKRSNLVMTTALLSGAVFLSACQEEEVETINFQNVSQCMQQRPSNETFDNWEKMCEATIANAKADHERVAPRYEPSGSDGDDLCEEQHGDDQCYQVTDSSGNSFWMPFLMGYVVSSAVDDVTGKRHYNTSQSRPLYYNYKQKSYMTSSGAFATRSAYGKNKIVASSLNRPVKPATVQTRSSVKASGGFGASRSVSSGISSGSKAGG